MPIIAPNDRVWVDGVIVYRDDLERLARLVWERLHEQSRVVSVRYRGHRGLIEKVALEDVDFGSVAVLDIAHGRVVVDVERGKLTFRLPHEYQDRKIIGDFFKTLERIKAPTRILYLIRKPDPYRIELNDLTRAQAGRQQKRDMGKIVAIWAGVAGVVSAIVAVVALFR